jgi:hypothetical protein
VAEVTLLTQTAPVDEYGRALYAVARSVVRAMLDQIGRDDVTDLGCDGDMVTMRQLSKLARLVSFALNIASASCISYVRWTCRVQGCTL